MDKRAFITKPSPLISFALIIAFISFADALMSFTAPVFLEDKLQSPLLMGLIVASSSAVALIYDSAIAPRICRKNLPFFLKYTLVFAFLSPFILLFFPSLIPFFVGAAVTWGIYYELIQFSKFRFVKAYLPPDQYPVGWGVLSSFKSFSYAIGPLIGALLVLRGDKLPFLIAVAVVVVTSAFVTLFVKSYHHKDLRFKGEIEKRGILKELRIWRILYRKIWMLWSFVFSVILVDSFFWTVGAILAGELAKRNSLGSSFLTLYILPSLFVGFVTARAAKPFGKKRIAFVSGALSGVLLMVMSFAGGVYETLLLCLLSSIFGALTFPEIMAIFEDYAKRLGALGDDIISLERSAENAAYVAGPIIAGLVSGIVGFQKAFLVAGAVLALVSICALVMVPRKIKMPQTELNLQLT